MLLREAPSDDTRLQVRLAYNQVYSELSPEQQSQFSFDTVYEHVHQTVRQQRELTLINELPDDHFDAAISADCAVAMSAALIDLVMFVFQVVLGPGSTAARPAAREVVGLLSEETISVSRAILLTWRNASNAQRAAMAYKVFAGIVRVTGLKKIYSIIKKSMHWYDWALMAVIIIAQIILWVASDGVSAIAEIALIIVSATALTIAIVKAITTCVSQPVPPIPPTSPIEIDRGYCLAPGAPLLPGEKLVSLNGAFFAVLQGDGNFVIYSEAGVPEWQTGIARPYLEHVKELIFQKNGDLVLNDTNEHTYWSSGTSVEGTIFCMLSNYGNLSIGNGDTVYWSKPGKDPGT